MKENEVILKRQSASFSKMEIRIFFFNWLLGIGEVLVFLTGELYYLAQGLGKNHQNLITGKCFVSHGNYLEQKVSHSGLSEQTKGTILSRPIPFVQQFSL